MARNIPVMPTVIQTYKLTFANFLYAIKISWIWFALMIILVYLAASLFDLGGILSMSPAELQTGAGAEAAQQNAGPFVLTMLIFFILFCIGWASVAVLWHRHLLQGEMLAGVPMDLTGRMGSYIWRFIGIALIVGLVGMALMMIYGPITLALIEQQMVDVDGQPTLNLSTSAFILHLIISSIFFGIIGLVFTRLGISLPAVAIDNRSFTISDALQVSAGNSINLFMVNMLVNLPILTLDLLVSSVTANSLIPSFLQGTYTLGILNLAYFLFITLLGVTLLSILYGFLVENKPIDGATTT